MSTILKAPLFLANPPMCPECRYIYSCSELDSEGNAIFVHTNGTGNDCQYIGKRYLAKNVFMQLEEIVD